MLANCFQCLRLIYENKWFHSADGVANERAYVTIVAEDLIARHYLKWILGYNVNFVTEVSPLYTFTVSVEQPQINKGLTIILQRFLGKEIAVV